MRYQESKRIGRQLDEITPCNDDLIALAERELAAFAAAVKELFGPEQEHVSAMEWICELESSNWSARPGVAEFRQFTAAASAKLAHRQSSQSFIRHKREAPRT